MQIKSPITKSDDVVMEKEIETDFLIRKYREDFGIDVSRFFSGLEKIQVYRCKKSRYRFYYPLNLEGDSDFYAAFQQFDWYYMPWKWEHEKTMNYVSEGMHVLEVGCAKGDFLKRLQEDNIHTTGLELNREAIKVARERGLEVHDISIQEYAETNPGKFDVVCSYQVLEHIADVKSFLDAKIKTLRKGGTLIVSVPNNESFIKYADKAITNMPPHHMGLWDTASLTELTSFFPVKLKKIYYEPLQDYHFDTYKSTFEDKLSNVKMVKKLYDTTGVGRFSYPAMRLFKNSIKGHTIMAVYEKL